MNIIHTADIHLDASFAGVGMPPAYANRRRQALRDVFQQILRRAAEWPADAVLIAGDLFEHDRISRDTTAFLRSSFEMIRPIPIFIAPGNHDPFMPASPYCDEAWPANVYIFSEPQWAAFELRQCPLTVHGFAFDGPDISTNPFGQLHIIPDDRIHIAVAHGSEKSHQPPYKRDYAPFSISQTVSDALHYLALGHFHETLTLSGSFTTLAWYAGAPEGHGFHECGERYFLEIEIDEQAAHPEKTVQVRKVPSAKTIYRQYTLDCGRFEHSQQLIERLRQFAAQERCAQVARVRLQGLCPDSLRNEITAVQETVAEDFTFLDIYDETQSTETYDSLAREDTSLGLFIARINAEIEDAPDAQTRSKLMRARDIGLSAYRGIELPIHGLDGTEG